VGYSIFNEDKSYFEFIKVFDDYRRQGVATAIYNYVETLGYKVKPSHNLEPDGEEFWKNRKLHESDEDEPYGYWISPNGDLYSVPFEGHEDAIEEIENCSYGDAIHAGWIRTVNTEYLHAEFSFGSVTLRAILRLKAMGRGKSKFYLDYHSGKEDDDMISEEFSSEREFNRAIRQAVKKN
jgi:hypothetical protein